MYTLLVASAVRGYHEYKDVWYASAIRGYHEYKDVWYEL